MREMALVGTVVGIRYHDLVCSLKLGKPTCRSATPGSTTS